MNCENTILEYLDNYDFLSLSKGFTRRQRNLCAHLSVGVKTPIKHKKDDEFLCTITRGAEPCHFGAAPEPEP